MKKLLLLSLLCASLATTAHQYWSLDDEREGIVWNVDSTSYGHGDHIEMSGRHIAAILRYQVGTDGSFIIDKSLVFPMLRTIPNDTHASFQRHITIDVIKSMMTGRETMSETVESISIAGGCLSVESTLSGPKADIRLHLNRCYFTSTESRAFIELYTVTNTGGKPLKIEVPSANIALQTNANEGIDAPFTVHFTTNGVNGMVVEPDSTIVFSAICTATRRGESLPYVDANAELAKRKEFVALLGHALKLRTPNDTINRMMDFAKVRVCESIYATKGGPLQSPGGESYYAAIWANDQAEYANPFFPFVGYDYGNESAENSFHHFARYMNDEGRPIPSSIIAEGDDYWNGAGDRGDAAMIAYGAARYALAKGDRATAIKLLPLIEWCLTFCHNKINAEGVVCSDHDELEGRFPAGDANLCTNALYYDALLSAAYVLDDLNRDKTRAKQYRLEARELLNNIEQYFAGPVEGFDTYAYYKGNDVLRAWICIPLTMGIYHRAEPTIEALFSPRLWSENGLLTEANDNTYWDRSTLYALRGVFQAQYPDRALPFLESYTATRLLGDHVPYAIEAWPEGNQRHLSTESALYARIFTEGLFGIRPTGFRSFDLSPSMPASWNEMSLSNIMAFGNTFSIDIHRVSADKINIKVLVPGRKPIIDKTVTHGKTVKVTLK